MKSLPLSIALVVSLFGASTVLALGPQDSPRPDDDFIDRYGFEQVTQDLGVDGRERFVLRPAGRLHEDVQLAVVVGIDRAPETMVLVVSKDILDEDALATRTLLGDFVRRVTRDSSDEPLGGHLAHLIQHEDPAVRRGEPEFESTCCAIPPVDPRVLEAVEVVDGLREGAIVRWEHITLRFGSTPDGQADPEVWIVASAGPEELVEALFTAARQEDPSSLAGYCHPAIETDGDVADICAMTRDSDGWASFVEWFRTGVVVGPVEIEGEVARVPFRFGPEGDREETMELHLWGERWYLRAF